MAGIKRSSGAYYGLQTDRLETAHLCLEYLATAGPRIIQLALADGGENLLASTPDLSWDTPFGPYHLYGGHRLWHAPEQKHRTSIPDDRGLVIEEIPQGVRLHKPLEPGTRLGKTVEIRLDPASPTVTLRHKIHNRGLWAVELAPWAITQLNPGGIAVLPQPRGPSLDEDGLLPNRTLVLWPNARWNDSRLCPQDDLIIFDTSRKGGLESDPIKVGSRVPDGWMGYFWNGVFFRKRFAFQPNGQYPDMGCNAEIYANERFLELESLGPLALLAPGASVEHVEIWEVRRCEQPHTFDDVRALLAELA